MRNDLTQDQVKGLLSYDPDTGSFKWLPRPNIKAGVEAGRTGRHGYRLICVMGKEYMAHRLAWLYVHGVWPDQQTDHINGVRTDNRIKNLRLVSAVENGRNKRISSRNTSGVTGVFWSKSHSRWIARIKVDGRAINIGTFECFESAVAARKAAEKEYGFHENHGRTSPCYYERPRWA